MSRARVAVLSVITNQLSVTAAATEYGYSRRQLQRLLARYRESGLDAVEPRSRRPLSNAAATPQRVRERIVELRLQLTKDGLDAGPVTIAWLRYDHVDANGKISFRRAGRMHHLGIGTTHAGKRALAIADTTTVTVIDLDTGELLSTHTINPTKAYWRNTQKAPGRWPEAP